MSAIIVTLMSIAQWAGIIVTAVSDIWLGASIWTVATAAGLGALALVTWRRG